MKVNIYMFMLVLLTTLIGGIYIQYSLTILKKRPEVIIVEKEVPTIIEKVKVERIEIPVIVEKVVTVIEKIEVPVIVEKNCTKQEGWF